VIAPSPHHPFSTRAYVEAAACGAQLVNVPGWKTSVITRCIPGTDYRDAIGCYPFLPFAPHVDIACGLAELKAEGIVSVVLVTDPLHEPSADGLSEFDFCRPYKTHYMFDRSLGPINYTRRRWREVKQARDDLRIAEVDYPAYASEFSRLYGNLINQHQIVGAAAFDDQFFDALKNVPGIRAIAAWAGDDLVSMMTFVVFEGTAYSYLAGTTPEGRLRRAHYGLYAEALEGFMDARILNLGGAPGFKDDSEHGIVHVKRKLANTTRMSLLCGAVLVPEIYASLMTENSASRIGGADSFFPAYRSPLMSTFENTREPT
jgi:hypothetical protein